MRISAPDAGWLRGSPKKSQVINQAAAVVQGGSRDQIERVHRRRMCLSHEKTHSLPDKSFGEPVDEPVQKWASLHIKFHQLSIRLDLLLTSQPTDTW